MPSRLIAKSIATLGHYCKLGICLFLLTPGLTAKEPNWFDRQTEWHSYEQFHFKIATRDAYIVAPRQPATGNPWIWRARFPGYHAQMDIALVEKGYHIGYVDVGGMFGSPQAMAIGDQFYEYVTKERKLAAKPALEGVSRGGLFVYNWAAANPDKVACIYCDTPVCDIKSWPGGKGNGLGSPPTWQQCLKAYGLTDEEAQTYAANPVDRAAVLAAAKIPLLHIVSESDRVVPPAENTYLLRDRLAKLEHPLEVISVPKGTEKSNGHHFEHPEPNRVVEFISKHSSTASTERMDLLHKSKRIVFLGDSITHAGQYVAMFDAWLVKQKLESDPIVINVGLPSETVSGLSEDGHAGGKFPRPDLAERLERVLKVTQPDLVFACYGINCGIYQPFDDQRLAAYQRGIKNLKQHVNDAGAKLVLITPPSFDDKRAKKPFSYNGVLDEYTKWLVSQRAVGWQVIDLHTAMTQELEKRRQTNPEFTFQPDSVHPNGDGHQYIARKLIGWFDGKSPLESSKDILPTITQRMNLRRDAYLSAAGHKRPGIPAGLPVEQAEEQAQQLTKELPE